jgi:large subunit ribosomal protein L15
MKLHDLHPVPGSRRERTRVGRGIAAGKGKTAGRGTKGQRSRTGSSIPAWFEGGQTPIHMRVPKLRGFKNRFRVAYAVVNIGRIEAALSGGRLEPGPRGAPATVNAEMLFAAGLIGRPNLPLKILGGGELEHPVLAIADAFSGEAKRKIEAAGGTAMILEVPEAAAAIPHRPNAEVVTHETGARSSSAGTAPRSATSAPRSGRSPAEELAPPATGPTAGPTEAEAAVEARPVRRAPAGRPKKAAPEAQAVSATTEATTAESAPAPKPARRARKIVPETPETPETTAPTETPETPATPETTETPETPA